MFLLCLVFGAFAFLFTLWQRRLEKQDFWIEYVSPGRLRAGPDDSAVVYHEGENSIYFYGKCRSGQKDLISVPNVEHWETAAPVWAKSRREIIVERLRQAQKTYHFEIHED